MFRRVVGGFALLVVSATIVVALVTNHSFVTTPSMYPTIPPGSMMFLQKQHHYHVGEVIEFRANGLVWAHRLVAVKPNGAFITRGDNPLSSADVFTPPVTQADVIGAVVVAPRWLGFPELISHDPVYGLSWLRFELGIPGKLAVLGVVALLCAAYLIEDRREAVVA